MHTAARIAIVAAALAAIARVAALRATPEKGQDERATASGHAPALPSPCPPGTLPDEGVCIPVPAHAGGDADAGNAAARGGRWRVYDRIPRRPERAADYRRYHWPVSASAFTPGQDEQGIVLTATPDAEIRLVALDHQVGDAEVLAAGKGTLVLRQAVREAGRLRDYLVFYRGLAQLAPELARGKNVQSGARLGVVGNTGTLLLDTRRVRHGVDPASIAANALDKDVTSVECDPRNVLATFP